MHPDNHADKLPASFLVRKYPDYFHVIVPDGYKFNHVNNKK